MDFETFSKSDFRAVKVLECEVVPKSKKLLKFVLDDGAAEKCVILSGIHEFYEPEQLVGKTCIAITNLPPTQYLPCRSSEESIRMSDMAVHLLSGSGKMIPSHITALEMGLLCV